MIFNRVVYLDLLKLILIVSFYSGSLASHEQGDECGGLTDFEPGSSVNYSFSNFSFKVSAKKLLGMQVIMNS